MTIPNAADADVNALNRIFLALADPTRRAILQRLGEGEARVTTLAEPFSISLNSVSKHLQALEGAGLVIRRRSGREHLLSLSPEALDRAAEWIAHTQSFWSSGMEAMDALLSVRNTDEKEQVAHDQTN
ncbi:metalloregulator ArsR/SmtB family transcription factor [Streptosporangium oxazolinicum]